MNEISLGSYEGTFWKRNDCLRQKRKSKFALIFRCFVLLSVVIVYLIVSVLNHAHLKNTHRHRTTEKYLAVNGRQLLGLYKATDLNYSLIVANNSATDSTTPSTASSTPTSSTIPSNHSLNCTQPGILHFPSDGFTREERRYGWITLHIVIALYCFWLLAAICDDYFVPAIEQICATIKLQKDVVGATIMAAATSSPELFMNCVGTFVTKGDIGVGTIVGSAVFNILAVPACCGFFVGQYVRLDWWPITRDCLMYCVAVLALIGTLSDGIIMWYEALGLAIGYFFYMGIMYYNDKMARTARKLISKYRRKLRPVRPFKQVNEITPLVLSMNNNKAASGLSLSSDVYQNLDAMEKMENDAHSSNSISSDEGEFAESPWVRNGRSLFEFLLRWPITLLLWLTIADCRKHKSLKYLTFALSVTWIGTISYLVAYVITIVGDTLDIPDSVMGLTILAAGMSVPEAVSSIIVTKQGQGAMGISNSIGSNTFDILLCLGLPWFVKAYFLPERPGEQWVILQSTGLTYSAVFLLTTLFGLYITFVANKFILDWKIGVACSVMYIGFMIIASMIELNVFFPVNLPICDH